VHKVGNKIECNNMHGERIKTMRCSSTTIISQDHWGLPILPGNDYWWPPTRKYGNNLNPLVKRLKLCWTLYSRLPGMALGHRYYLSTLCFSPFHCKASSSHRKTLWVCKHIHSQ